jgi:RNA polymerase-binding protein DksA
MAGTAGKKPAARRPGSGAPSRTRTSPARPARPAAKTAKAAGARKPAPKKAPARAARKAAPKKAAPAKKPTAKKATPAKKPTAKKTGPATKPPAKATRPAAKPAPAKAAKAPAAKPAKAAAKVAKATKVAKVAVRPGSDGAAKGRSGKKTVICPLSGFEVTPGPANLGAKTLERLRQKLLDEKDRLRHQAEELTAEAEQLAREREAGDTQFDEESGEGDTVNIERERDLLLSATARQVVDEIDDALERIRRNKYGVCKPAGRKISLERLEAIPWAQVCVDCKARAERRR